MTTHNRFPLLDKLYLRYLDDENSATFISAVSCHYMECSLERLASFGSDLSRRGGVLALGFLGTYRSNAVMGRGLRDRDRIVRMLAENGIREIWRRDGSVEHRHELGVIIRQNDSFQFEEAVERATELIEAAPWFAEAWNQRAISLFRLKRFEAAANDCFQTLELNPYHFAAAVGMAHCYLELSEGYAALDCFRRAVDINPSLDAVQGQIEYLQRALDET